MCLPVGCLPSCKKGSLHVGSILSRTRALPSPSLVSFLAAPKTDLGAPKGAALRLGGANLGFAAQPAPSVEACAALFLASGKSPYSPLSIAIYDFSAWRSVIMYRGYNRFTANTVLPRHTKALKQFMNGLLQMICSSMIKILRGSSYRNSSPKRIAVSPNPPAAAATLPGSSQGAGAHC